MTWVGLSKILQRMTLPTKLLTHQRFFLSSQSTGRSKFRGKRAVITGGAQGLGFALSRRLIECGASVTLWDVDMNALVKARAELLNASVDAIVDIIQVDVTQPESVKSAAKPGVDILVCSAGITGGNYPTIDFPLEEWRRVLDINMTGVFLCNKYLLPHMISQGYGRIVNVSSIAGKEGNPNAVAYSASKAGVIALTKSVAKETAAFGDISVNCVTPAAARTRIFDQMSQQHIEYMLSKIPRGRFLEVEEFAHMVTWLVSNENSFTTGAVFDLSGGRATY